MDFGEETNWFAVQAKPFQEKLAAASVVKFDAEIFLPRIKQEQSCGTCLFSLEMLCQLITRCFIQGVYNEEIIQQ